MGLVGKLIKKPLGCLFSLLFSLLLLLVVLVVVAVLVLDHFAAEIAAREVKQQTGFVMTTAKQDVGLFHGLVDLQGVSIKNPARFPSPDFLEFKQLKVQVDPWSVSSKKLEIDEVVVDIESISVVRGKDGEFNVVSFGKSFGGGGTAAASTQPAAEKQFIIKNLTIRLHSARYLDFKGGDGAPKVMTLDYERKFTDITPENLSSVKYALVTDLGVKGVVFLAEPLGNAILDPTMYRDALKTIVGSGQKLITGADELLQGAGETAKDVGDFVKGLFN